MPTVETCPAGFQWAMACLPLTDTGPTSELGQDLRKKSHVLRRGSLVIHIWKGACVLPLTQFVEERHKNSTGGFIINTATGDLTCYKSLQVFHILCDNFKNGVCPSSSQLVSMEAWGKDESDHWTLIWIQNPWPFERETFRSLCNKSLGTWERWAVPNCIWHE